MASSCISWIAFVHFMAGQLPHARNLAWPTLNAEFTRGQANRGERVPTRPRGLAKPDSRATCTPTRAIFTKQEVTDQEKGHTHQMQCSPHKAENNAAREEGCAAQEGEPTGAAIRHSRIVHSHVRFLLHSRACRRSERGEGAAGGGSPRRPQGRGSRSSRPPWAPTAWAARPLQCGHREPHSRLRVEAGLRHGRHRVAVRGAR